MIGNVRNICLGVNYLIENRIISMFPIKGNPKNTVLDPWNKGIYIKTVLSRIYKEPLKVNKK